MSERRRPRVVIDTNILISGVIVRRGNPYEIVVRWRAGEFVLLLSSVQREEIDDVIHRPKIRQKYGLTDEEIADLLWYLDSTAEAVAADQPLRRIVRDPGDEAILATALSGNADYLVSGDQDLLALRNDSRLGELNIVTAVELLDVLMQWKRT